MSSLIYVIAGRLENYCFKLPSTDLPLRVHEQEYTQSSYAGQKKNILNVLFYKALQIVDLLLFKSRRKINFECSINVHFFTENKLKSTSRITFHKLLTHCTCKLLGSFGEKVVRNLICTSTQSHWLGMEKKLKQKWTNMQD